MTPLIEQKHSCCLKVVLAVPGCPIYNPRTDLPGRFYRILICRCRPTTRGDRRYARRVLWCKDAENPRLRKLESAGPNPRIPRLVRGHSAAHAAGLQRAHTGRGRAAGGRGSAADRPANRRVLHGQKNIGEFTAYYALRTDTGP